MTEIALIAPVAIISGLAGAFIVIWSIEVPRPSHALPSVITKRIRKIHKQEIERLAKQLTKRAKRTRI